MTAMTLLTRRPAGSKALQTLSDLPPGLLLCWQRLRVILAGIKTTCLSVQMRVTGQHIARFGACTTSTWATNDIISMEGMRGRRIAVQFKNSTGLESTAAEGGHFPRRQVLPIRLTALASGLHFRSDGRPARSSPSQSRLGARSKRREMNRGSGKPRSTVPASALQVVKPQ